VLAHDLLAFMDALQIQRGVLAGYDWGGRAACIVAALWPERVIALVSGAGYNIQHIPSANKPETPEHEYQLWYHYYFHSERGRAGLQQHRYELCRLLWRLWSPNWAFSEAVYRRTAESFNNLDFVDVVIHSYRVRYDLVPGDPSVASTEKQLIRRPPIAVPTIVLHGHDNGVIPVAGSEVHRQFFTSDYERRVIPMVGHNLPQEAPRDFSAAVLSVINRAK
jgi:pimeloyl-ACP methyl ester carboxylesterase